MTGSDRLAAPGELDYRAGTYRSFLAAMLRGARRKPPLATLNVQAEGDFTISLLSGWARVCDVLTFYQERIANEGYLPTATETVSILHLTSQIGARRRPAIGAEASLAVQLLDAAGQPDSVTIQPGPSLAVQNAPASPDTLPIVFESGQRIVLRTAWNGLAPVIPPVSIPPALWSGARSLRLVGTSTGLRPGSALVLTTDGGRSWLAIADSVQVDRSLGVTLITWTDPVPAIPDDGRLTIIAVTQFNRTAGLFGDTAMSWPDVSEQQQQAIGVRAGGIMALDKRGASTSLVMPGPLLWRQSPDADPPPPNVQALLDAGGGAILAATDKGVSRSTDMGLTWPALTLAPGRQDVRALHRDGDGTLYAGTELGQLFTSLDGGGAWLMLTQTVSFQPDGAPGYFQLFDLGKKAAAKKGAESQWTLACPIRAVETHATKLSPPSDLYIGTEQGVFAMLGNSPQWQPFNTGFPGLNAETGAADVFVAALAAVTGVSQIAGGNLVAATNRGVYISSLAKAEWHRAVSPLPDGSPLDCTSLAVVGGGEGAFVGTSTGVFRLSALQGLTAFNDGLGQPVPAILSLAIYDGRIFAATAAGIFSSGLDAANWQSLDVQDLTLFSIDPVFAGDPKDPHRLDAGVVSTPLRRRFERFGIDLVQDVEVVKLYAPGTVDRPHIGWQLREAAPSARIFRIYREAQLRVTQLTRNLIDPADLVAATDTGLLASLPLGPVVNQEWPDFAIATGETRIEGPVDAVDVPVAGAEVALDRKPVDPVEMPVAGAEIFLDRKIDEIEAHSQVVQAPAGTSLKELAHEGASLDPRPRVHRVRASEAMLRKAFGKQGTVSQIIVDPSPELLASDLRTTNVYLSSEAAAAFTATNPDLRPLTGQVLVLPGVYTDLAKGRSVQVSGPRPAAAIMPVGPPSTIVAQETPIAFAAADAAPALDQQMVAPGLRDIFTAASIKLSATPSVAVVLPGARWLIRDGDNAWRLELPADADEALPLRIFTATLYEVVAPLDPPAQGWTLVRGDQAVDVPDGAGEIVWQGATSDQASFSEIAVVEEAVVRLESNSTEITLSRPLTGLYDGAKCGVCANIVRVTQGQTVQGEVLGSGQPGQAGQRFTLHNAPLTYACDGSGIHGELRVEVNGDATRALRFGGGASSPAPPGETWREIRSLAFAEPGQRVYMVTTDEAGRATVRFGDGVRGARLPSGADNVAANYRYGAGAQGNVPAGSLIALRNRPSGIRSATNPVAATGGKDAEPIDLLRVRAPLRLETLGRIVALDDYEAFARNFPGIGRAQAALITPPGQAPLVALTVVTDDWQPISQAPKLGEALTAAIEARRADRLDLRLLDPIVAPFDVGVTVSIDAGADAALVTRRVRRTLVAAFGAERHDFGAPVYPEDVVQALAAVPGLGAVELDALFRRGSPAAGTAALAAAPMRLGPEGSILPAEWLVIDDATGITVTVRP